MATPTEVPVTTPPETVATLVVPVDHAPPEVASVNVTLPPTHTVADAGEMAAGPALTVMTFVAVQLPTE